MTESDNQNDRPDGEALRSEAPAEPTEQPMEIHKPKPVHNWRELASEIGVIVVGILIALGLEQAVATRHLHEDMRVEREAIRSELRGNLVTADLLRQMKDCTTIQIQELSSAISRGDRARVRSLMAMSALPRPVGWPDASWQAFLASDASKAFDLAERQNYSGLYAFVDALNRKQERYVNSYARLRALALSDLAASPEAARVEVSEMAEMTAALSDMRELAEQFPISAAATADLRVPKHPFVPPEFLADKQRCLVVGAALRSSAG